MSCYICGKPATSVEHSPAKSFFPPQFRDQLITVDSCEEHNEATSMEDEYARVVIIANVVNNDEAKTYFQDKPLRGLKKSPKLAERLAESTRQVFVKDEYKEDAELENALQVQIERDRIDEVMRKVAYGIFYHEYGMPWNRALNIGTEHLVDQDLQPDLLGQLIIEGKRAMVIQPFLREPILRSFNIPSMKLKVPIRMTRS